MNQIDKRDKLKENPFSYKIINDNKIRIFYFNKMIKILNKKDSLKLLLKIEKSNEFNTQLALAKITGNFKRGNEKIINKTR